MPVSAFVVPTLKGFPKIVFRLVAISRLEAANSQIDEDFYEGLVIAVFSAIW